MHASRSDVPVYIIGYGDIGKRVASLLPASSHVMVVCRNRPDPQTPVSHVLADLDDEHKLPDIDVGNSVIFYFAPPPSAGLVDLRMQRFLQAIHGQVPARIVYISTTGVYGDSKGEWIDEQTEPAPATDRGRRRLDAEKQQIGRAHV